ncbi:MAG: T9SS type A sorting domain-containing protein [Chitinophagales bacterium]|nr:T9SS type A sorting domain-containing protein [Chitinophagales bacterium]
MKAILLSILAVMMISPVVMSSDGNETVDQQSINTIDLTGTWVGTRSQYDRNGNEFIAEFDYIFELKQDGKIVSGLSYIKNGDENFAEIKVKGRVIGNQLHFQEYEIINERKPANRLWCYKIGVLEISVNISGVTMLQGNTQSYTSKYYIPCTGGFTALERIEDYNNSDEHTTNKSELIGSEKIEGDFIINIYPNPFTVTASIEYILQENTDLKVTLYNLEGRLIKQLVNESQVSGSHSIQIDAVQLRLAPGVYVLEFKAGEALYSKQIVVSSH